MSTRLLAPYNMENFTPIRLQAAFTRHGYTWRHTGLNLLGVRSVAADPTTFNDFVVAAFVLPPPPRLSDPGLFANWAATYGLTDAQGAPLTRGPGQEPATWAAINQAVGRCRVLAWPATTLPGSDWLRQSTVGTQPGLLLPGQYADAYELTPGGLRQTGAPVRCAPAGSGLEAQDGPSGYFGLDISGPVPVGVLPSPTAAPVPTGLPAAAPALPVGTPPPDPAQPEPWNPGRQVLAHAADYAQLLRLCAAFAPESAGRFTYTLLLEQELPPATFGQP